MWSWGTDTQADSWKTTRYPQINTDVCSQLTFSKGLQITQLWKWWAFQTNGAGTIGKPRAKAEIRPKIKITPQWIIEVTVLKWERILKRHANISQITPSARPMKGKKQHTGPHITKRIKSQDKTNWPILFHTKGCFGNTQSSLTISAKTDNPIKTRQR